MATTLYGSGEERQMWLERVDLAYQIVLLFQDSRFDQVIVPLVSSYIKRFSFCWLRSINSISGISKEFYPKKLLDITAFRADGSSIVFQVVTRLDSPIEVDYYKNGGILHYYLRGKLKE